MFHLTINSYLLINLKMKINKNLDDTFMIFILLQTKIY